MGTVLGPLLGAIVLSVVNEVLWANYPQVYLASVGVIVLLAVLFTPRGLVNIGMRWCSAAAIISSTWEAFSGRSARLPPITWC